MASLDDMVTVGNSVNKNISQLILAINNFASLYNSVIAVANGGTGNSSLTANSVLTGNGTNPIVAEPFFVCDNSGNVGIGTSSPITGANVSLTANGCIAVKGTLTVDQTSTGIMDFSSGSQRFISYGSVGTVGQFEFISGSGGLSPTRKVIIDSAGDVGIGVTSPTAVLHLKAGTATANTAPLKFTSGTNLTTAEAGVIEYDGTIISATTNTNFKRGTIPIINYTSGTGTTLGTNTESTAVVFLPAANDTITLSIGTYLIETQFIITRGASVTSAQARFSLLGNGNAVGSFSGMSIGSSVSGTETVNNQFSQALSSTNINVTGASITSTGVYVVFFKAIVKITTAGTLIPTYSLSANINGAGTVNNVYYFTIQQLDTQSAAAFGPAGAGWG